MSHVFSVNTLRTLLSLVGTAYVSYSAFAVAKFVWHFVRPSRLHIYNHSDPWALVTGASDGIGLGFAEELLSRGFNVLLHGRNEAKLKKVVARLSEEHPSRLMDFVIADASEYGKSFEVVVKKVKSLPGKLTVLINNVGGIHTTPTYVPFSEISHDAIDSSQLGYDLTTTACLPFSHRYQF
jgi:NADP-dependent 3-hydroxy acid dehydrogenase YdfG